MSQLLKSVTRLKKIRVITFIFFKTLLRSKIMHPCGVNVLFVLLTLSLLSHYLGKNINFIKMKHIYFSQIRQEIQTTAYEGILSILDTIQYNYISIYILLYTQSYLPKIIHTYILFITILFLYFS